MGKYRALAKNAAIISVGTLLSKLVVFFMVRFYTGVLSPAEYGTGDLLITTVSLLIPFVSFDISDGVFRFLPEYPDADKSIFSIGIYTVTVGTLIFILFLPLLYWANVFKGYLLLLALMTMAACYHSVSEQYVRASGDTATFAFQGLLNTLLVVTLNIVLLKVFRMGVTGYVMSVAIADTVCTLFLFIKKKLWKLLTRNPESSLLRKMLRYSIPLIPTSIFWWITSVSDRYMVSWMISDSANGIYTVANKLPTILTLLSGVLMQAWQYSAVTEAKSDIKEQARFYTNVWFALLSSLFLTGSVMIAFSRLEIKILADAAYSDAWHYVPLLCAAMVFCAFTSFMGSVYTVAQKSTLSFWTSLLGAGINIVLNAILIPSPLGIYGAAIATFISYLVVFVIRAGNVGKFIPFRLFRKIALLNSAVLIIQVAFISFEWPLWQMVQVLSIIALIIIDWKQFMEKFGTLLGTIRKRK